MKIVKLLKTPKQNNPDYVAIKTTGYNVNTMHYLGYQM